jgi:hypothetical protein
VSEEHVVAITRFEVMAISRTGFPFFQGQGKDLFTFPLAFGNSETQFRVITPRLKDKFSIKRILDTIDEYRSLFFYSFSDTHLF